MIMLIVPALAAVVATIAVAEATRWPLVAVLPVTLLCGLLVAALTRAIASGPTRSWRSLLGRAAAALGVGVIIGELAALAVFAGSIDRQLDRQAAREAESAPAVLLASAELARARDARTALDDAVGQARLYRDDALVVARCESHPTSACPQTRITGVPGAGPETRTAKDLLNDAQQELDHAMAVRERQAPSLDNDIATAERTLAAARDTSVTAADRGLGARWVAMNDYSGSHSGVLLLRLTMIGVFTLLALLPLIARRWRGETIQDRHAAARAEVDHAELQAATAVAVKRAELRAAAETLWAEQQLVNTRLAVEAQTEIDEAAQRRRVAEALGGPVEAPVLELPAAAEQLPARLDPGQAEKRETPLLPAIPDIARTATRWIRPLVPPVVGRVIGTTTRPMRTMRQVFEEVEEITFTLKRTHRVNVGSVATADQQGDGPAHLQAGRRRSDALSTDESPLALTEGDRPGELREPEGRRALPPG